MIFVSAYYHGDSSSSLIHFVFSAQAASNPAKQQALHARHVLVLFSPVYIFISYHASFQCLTIRLARFGIDSGADCWIPILYSSLGSLKPLIPMTLFLTFYVEFLKIPEILK